MRNTDDVGAFAFSEDDEDWVWVRPPEFAEGPAASEAIVAVVLEVLEVFDGLVRMHV
jgi:hypothetical protein